MELESEEKKKKEGKGVEKQLKKKKTFKRSEGRWKSSKVIQKVKVWKSSCVMRMHMLKSITAFYPLTWLFFHSPFIWPQYSKLHESVIQLCISRQCQSSNDA